MTAARAISKLVAFYVILLIPRSMSPDNYGRFGLLVIFASLTSTIVDLGLRPLFTREVAKDRTRLTPYLNSILSLKLVMGLPALLVLFVAIRIQLPDAIYTVFPTLALLLATSFANQMRATFYAMARLRYEAISIVGETLILLAATIAVAVLHLTWWYFLWAYTASYVFTIAYAAVIAVGRFNHRFRFDLDLVRLGSLARESIPFALTFIITTLYYKVDQPLLKIFTEFSVVGLYVAAYKLLDAVAFIPQALMDPVYPTLAELSIEGGRRLQSATVRVYKVLAVVALPAATGMFLFAQPIIVLGVGRQYAGAASLVRILALGVPFLFVNNAFIYTLNAMGRQIESTRLAVLSLVFNVALNLVLIPQPSSLYGGAMGAAWATGLTEAVLFGGAWYLLRRHLFALPVVSSISRVLGAAVVALAAMLVILLTAAAMAADATPPLAVDVIALLIGGSVYVAVLLGAHAFTEDELATVVEGARSLVRR